jgi:hypothetical protein
MLKNHSFRLLKKVPDARRARKLASGGVHASTLQRAGLAQQRRWAFFSSLLSWTYSSARCSAASAKSGIFCFSCPPKRWEKSGKPNKVRSFQSGSQGTSIALRPSPKQPGTGSSRAVWVDLILDFPPLQGLDFVLGGGIPRTTLPVRYSKITQGHSQ